MGWQVRHPAHGTDGGPQRRPGQLFGGPVSRGQAGPALRRPGESSPTDSREACEATSPFLAETSKTWKEDTCNVHIP
jgi:hypothetical protein